jgi:peptidoglycan/xylan/chitin deacetylase (PgdA/CDA1 family)
MIPLAITGIATGIVSASAVWAYSIFAPRCQFWAPVIRSLPQRDAVSLTFDDGPHPVYTPRILDILAERRIKATFFIIGRFAREHPEVVSRIHAEGHVIGNHSWDHEHFGVNRKRAYWDHQLLETQKVIAGITGMPPMIFRPPMGFKTRHIAAAAAALSLPIIGWSVRALDTRPTTGEALAKRVLNRTAGHDILLLHDGVEPFRKAGSTQQATVDALPAILAGIAEKKLHAVSLIDALVAASDEMRARKNPPQLRT